MGSSQVYSTTESSGKPDLFDQAERVAFQHVGQALRDMPFCSLADLEQAAFSYAVQSFASSGIPVREEYARRKASEWASWWFRKHRDERQPRPHSQYSAAQALRGRTVAAIRKRGRTDWTALQVQLARASGVKVAEVAGELDCSRRYVFQLSRRRFSRLVLAVLVLALGGVNVPKSSAVATSEIQGIDPKETLRPFTLDAGTPGHPPPLGELADIERIGPQIADILRGHWAAQGL